MRRAPEYPTPSYVDPDDRRMVRLIRHSSSPLPRAVNILGVPYDGAVLGRKGAAEGPKGIRESMGGFSNYNVELGLSLERARVADLGDLALQGAGVVRTHAQIEAEVAGDISPNSLLVVLGGDNSVSLPALRAIGRKFRRLGLIVVDSHFDLRGMIGGKPTSGSSYGLAVETIEALDPRRVAEIGVHGFLNSKGYYEKAKKLGISLYPAGDVRRLGPERIARDAYRTASAGAEAVYLSIDMDAVDISQVSGVSAPSVGGIYADELATMAYEVAKKEKVRVADIVEVAPSLDPTGRSQRVAATALVSLIAGFTARKQR